MAGIKQNIFHMYNLIWVFLLIFLKNIQQADIKWHWFKKQTNTTWINFTYNLA